MDEDTNQAGSSTTPADAERTITLTLSENEREIVALALGELLSSVRRDEHLVPAVQRLLARVQRE